MGGLPLHPLVIHLPLGLAALWPFACAALLLALRAGLLPPRAWWGAVALAALLAGAALAAVETGEHDHDRVAERVGDALVHEHEEAAELFLWLCVAGGVASVAGALAPGRLARAARLATLALALASLAAAARTGHLGGRLVYVHGAAAVYTDPGGADGGATDVPPGGPGAGGHTHP